MTRRVRATDKTTTVGLVLGGGGFVGGAWHTGALQALEDVTGWAPRRADYLVGTSAGAMIAAVIAGGGHAADVPGLFYGEGLDELRSDAAGLARPQAATFRWHAGWRPTLGSGRLVWGVLRRSRQVPVAMAFAAVLPRGFISTEPVKEMVRRVIPEGWAPRTNLWLIACDLETGDRMVFGREGSPAADAATAVAASCAIPGFYHPVEIEGRLYVDGGCWSPSNLDVIADLGLDVAICINPTSSSMRATRWQSLRDWGRTLSGRRLGVEARMLRDRGARVVLLQPGAEDLRAMGSNYMRATNLDLVTDVARVSVSRQLKENHADVVELLRGRGLVAERGDGVVARALARIRGSREAPGHSARVKAPIQLQ
jgi:NTE family protein